MLVSEYITEFLRIHGTEHIFGYPGGMVTYLMDALDRDEGITAHINYHEQGAAFAACGYSSVSGKLGAAYATSGPGATNLLTGVAEAYFDSVPVLFITGQVNTYESKGDMSLRQKGFQETDIVSIAKPITKMAAAVNDEKDIPYMLEKALYIACEGRKGPVLLDIPMNIQRQEINPDTLEHFVPEEKKANSYNFSNIIELINNSERPCIIAGAGIKQTHTEKLFRRFADALKIPVLTSMIAVDILPSDYEFKYGFVGSYGDRQANFIAAKSDLIITIGSRLDCRQVGAKRENFAVNAKIVRLDTDLSEFENKIHDNDLNIEFQLEKDMEDLVAIVESSCIKNFADWLAVCNEIRDKLKNTIEKMYPEILISKLSEFVPDDLVITTDVGQNQVWAAQYFKVKENQQMLFSGGHGAMGYSIPAAIGASLASDRGMVISFCGDGGFMMNLQELQFISRERLPIKICILNNHALGMIRHFQEMYFDSRYVQTLAENGYTVPNFKKIANAFDLDYKCIASPEDLSDDTFAGSSPAIVECLLPETTYVFPKLAMNKPMQDQEPPIDRELYDQLDAL